MSGYAHAQYAESLREFGMPRELRKCQGWYLQRRIPGFSDYDGIGCYPLFACRDWSQLRFDLESLRDELVSLALVTDPFGDYCVTDLHHCFDVVIPFKEHYIVDVRNPLGATISKHHRYKARRSRRRGVHVERCQDPPRFVDEWVDLYATLVRRHQLKGIKAFSRAAFIKQLSTPGMVAFRAIYRDNTVGAHLWYVKDKVAYSHLVASSPLGYELRAAYALHWSAIEYFAARELQWLDLGAGAGSKSDVRDGLSQFKRGWSTETRTAYFCGRILNHARYSEIVRACDIPKTNYFPAYRKGEFGSKIS